LVGEVGAIYYTVFESRPVIAGVFFALAFGNRTEVLLTAPIFLCLLNRNEPKETERRTNDGSENARTVKLNIGGMLWFCLIPFVLGVATLIYNYVRFHSITDFGYARIPGVSTNRGITTESFRWRTYCQAGNAWKPWQFIDTFYLVPNGFSSSISEQPVRAFPFEIRFARQGLYLSWAAIALLTFLL
jgi:hypothetical protein